MAEYAGSETDLKAIGRVRDALVVAMNARDAQGCAAQFTADGVQMPPNAPANIGGPKIALWSQAFFDQFRVQFALAVDEVRVMDEWAFESGTYTLSLSAKAGGGPMQDIGTDRGMLGRWLVTSGTAAIHRHPLRSGEGSRSHVATSKVGLASAVLVRSRLSGREVGSGPATLGLSCEPAVRDD